jgi:copper chaperone CopZ
MNRLVRTTALLLGLQLLPSAASAELRRVQLDVPGMDCAYCVKTMSATIRKLEGVESIEVSLEKSSADIRLKAGNTITLAQIRRIVRSNGYASKDAQIDAKGKFVERDGRPVFDLLNGSALDLAATPPDARADAVEITGVSKPGEKDAEILTVNAVKTPESPRRTATPTPKRVHEVHDSGDSRNRD